MDGSLSVLELEVLLLSLDYSFSSLTISIDDSSDLISPVVASSIFSAISIFCSLLLLSSII